MRPAAGPAPPLGTYFPRPYPDEVIGSVIIRACRHLGLSLKRMNREILGLQQTNLPFLMSAQLGRLSILIGIPADQLLEQHTVFSYITGFLSHSRARLLRQASLRAQEDGLQSYSALIHNATKSTIGRRICPVCVRDELDRYHETYWHRFHLLPGILLCNIHDTPLREAISADDLRLLLPHEARTRAIGSCLSSKRLRLVGRQTECTITQRPAAPDRHKALLRLLADRAGYRLSQRDMASNQLSMDLEAFFGVQYLATFNCSLSSPRSRNWPGLMIQPATLGPFCPLKHILLRTFLQAVPKKPKPIVRCRPGPKPSDPVQMDERISALFLEAADDLAQSRMTENASDVLKRLGIWQAYRHHSKSLPKTRRAIDIFRQSPESAWRIRRPKK